MCRSGFVLFSLTLLYHNLTLLLIKSDQATWLLKFTGSAVAERETGATVWSCITWIPGFLKFYVAPYPLKFLFLVLWAPVREILFAVHKRVVVQCSKVDAMFSGKPKDIFKTSGGAETRFDRAVFLERLHGKRNILQDLWYWAKLATGRA